MGQNCVVLNGFSTPIGRPLLSQAEPTLRTARRRDTMLELVKSLQHQAFPKGSTLLREGDPGDGLYLIKKPAGCCISAKKR